MGFLYVAMNFLENKAGYLETGVWAKKALKEAKGLACASTLGCLTSVEFYFIFPFIFFKFYFFLIIFFLHLFLSLLFLIFFAHVLSTIWSTQRGSQSYTEKRRGRREIEVTRRRRGGVTRVESNLANNQFPKCSPQPRTPREIHRLK